MNRIHVALLRMSELPAFITTFAFSGIHTWPSLSGVGQMVKKTAYECYTVIIKLYIQDSLASLSTLFLNLWLLVPSNSVPVLWVRLTYIYGSISALGVYCCFRSVREVERFHLTPFSRNVWFFPSFGECGYTVVLACSIVWNIALYENDWDWNNWLVEKKGCLVANY